MSRSFIQTHESARLFEIEKRERKENQIELMDIQNTIENLKFDNQSSYELVSTLISYSNVDSFKAITELNQILYLFLKKYKLQKALGIIN